MIKLSPLGRELVTGRARAWTGLLGQPVSQVTRKRLGFRGASSRLRGLTVHLENGQTLPILVKFTTRSEARFYRSLACQVSIDLPHLYYAEEAGPAGVCLLQVLPPGKAVADWSEQDERRVLACLARIHAAWWQSPDLPALGLPSLSDELNARLDKAARGLALLRRMGGWPGVITLDILDVMEALVAERARLLAPLAGLPPTLIHGDAWQPNWILAADRCVLLDWQSTLIGPAVWDLVYFLEMSGESGGRLLLDDDQAIQVYLDALQVDAGRRAQFLAAVPAVSVLNTLARWPVYAVDRMTSIEQMPALACLWTNLPRSIQNWVGRSVAWTDLSYYQRAMARFMERARQVYGI